ncbi:MAG: ankyrin repeat domain-containing protein [Puniceicoccales bacterium]|jgi:hypothetical protein|nr:ankyrin repeat domain-containing protein [Puniceicoccales bacterium]
MEKVNTREIVLMLLSCFGVPFSLHASVDEDQNMAMRALEEVDGGEFAKGLEPRDKSAFVGGVSDHDAWGADQLTELEKASLGLEEPNEASSSANVASEGLNSERDSTADRVGDGGGHRLSCVLNLYKGGELQKVRHAPQEGGGTVDQAKERLKRVCEALAASKKGSRQRARHLLAQFVIDYPQDIDQKYNGRALIHYTAASGDGRSIKFLANNGANLSLKTDSGSSAIDKALREKQLWNARYLARHGQKYSAELLKRPDVVEQLLQIYAEIVDEEFLNGFDPDREDFDEQNYGGKGEGQDKDRLSSLLHVLCEGLIMEGYFNQQPGSDNGGDEESLALDAGEA